MSRMDSGPRLTDDARFELAMGAATRERRNRPVALLAISAAAVVVAVVVAVTGLTARASARSQLAQELEDLAAVEQIQQEWRSLESQSGAQPNLGAPFPTLFSTLENLAVGEAGMKEKPRAPRRNPQPTRNGITVIEYHYTDVKDPSLKALMEWVRLAPGAVPGLEVYSLDLKPDPTNWTMNVTFRRWERAG